MLGKLFNTRRSYKKLKRQVEARNLASVIRGQEIDLVIDVGANVGHYTLRMSELAGPTGRVIAIEPVPETFALLAANVVLAPFPNVTLLNVAASDTTQLAGMAIPTFDTGLKNYYQASLVPTASALRVLTVALDALGLPQRVSVVKIDAEGHDHVVLRGMEALLRRDHPALIVETDSPEISGLLQGMGYQAEHLPESPNVLFRHAPALNRA